jgi:hypothetical protein
MQVSLSPLVAGTLAVLWLASAGCGDGQRGERDGPEGDGQAQDPDDVQPGALLADGVAGRSCQAQGDSCWPNGHCASALTGGALFAPLVDPLSTDDGYCTAECSSDAQCGAESLCFGRGLLGKGGECRRSCEGDDDCRSGQECAKPGSTEGLGAELGLGTILPNTCQPLPQPDQLSDRTSGKPCRVDADCGEGRCADAEHERGGYCTGTCISDAHCGAGGRCEAGLYGSRGSCREVCEVDSDCQNDQNGWGCDKAGLCVREPDPVPAGIIGTPCSKDAMCGQGSCRTIGYAGERYPDGYCVSSCDEDADCGADALCVNRLTCLKKCSSNDGCRPEYECREHPQAAGTQGTICYPKPTP